MSIEEQAGREAPHWRSVAAAVLLIGVAVPGTLGFIASANRVPSVVPGVTVGVVRPSAPTEVLLADSRTDAGAKPAVIEDVKRQADARHLLDLFHRREYRVEEVRDGSGTVPRLVVAGLPRNLALLDDVELRKAVFVKTLLPLILIVNERIEADRIRISELRRQRVAGVEPSPRDRVWLTEMAERYRLDRGAGVDLDALLRRVDGVPPSMALAQAVEESGWGTSRFALDGNALFGQLTWSNSHSGIVPRNRRDGETHRFRSFDGLLGSVEAYVHNLNTHEAYRPFRDLRALQRKRGEELDGYRLVGTLERYSERGQDYIKAIRSVIKANGLDDFDRAALSHSADAILARATAP